jgi:hypothetical protein
VLRWHKQEFIDEMAKQDRVPHASPLKKIKYLKVSKFSTLFDDVPLWMRQPIQNMTN